MTVPPLPFRPVPLPASSRMIWAALVVDSTTTVAAPAVVAGVVVALAISGTTVNLQSFMGAIMAIGVSVANAILLVTFAEAHRRQENTDDGDRLLPQPRSLLGIALVG